MFRKWCAIKETMKGVRGEGPDSQGSLHEKEEACFSDSVRMAHHMRLSAPKSGISGAIWVRAWLGKENPAGFEMEEEFDISARGRTIMCPRRAPCFHPESHFRY